MSTDEKKKNIKWTNVMVDKFVRCMVSHAVNNFADNVFSKDVWTNIFRDFNEGSNQKLTKPQLQSKLAILKKKYLSFQKMKNNSGWGWNEDLGHPECDDRLTRFQKQSFLPIKSCFHPLLRTTSFTIISKIVVSNKNRDFCEKFCSPNGPLANLLTRCSNIVSNTVIHRHKPVLFSLLLSHHHHSDYFLLVHFSVLLLFLLMIE
jgi:hypothetical protein